MRAGDIADSRTLYLSRTGGRAHLSRSCPRLPNGATGVRAELVNPDIETCSACSSGYEPPEASLAAALEVLGPDDIPGLSGFGERRR